MKFVLAVVCVVFCCANVQAQQWELVESKPATPVVIPTSAPVANAVQEKAVCADGVCGMPAPTSTSISKPNKVTVYPHRMSYIENGQARTVNFQPNSMNPITPTVYPVQQQPIQVQQPQYVQVVQPVQTRQVTYNYLPQNYYQWNGYGFVTCMRRCN